MRAPHYSDPCWPAWFAAVAGAGVPSGGLGIQSGSLWTGKLTGRRGAVLWAQDGLVCLSFAEGRRIVIKQSTLLNRYTPTK